MDWFDEAYKGTPPWDIGRPQGAFVKLDEEGLIRGDVLDVGCGTGENVLYFALRGHVAWGLDESKRAIGKAEARAKARGLKATFKVGDALELGKLGRTFDTVADCGLFHVFDDRIRVKYRESLEQVLRPGGMFCLMCFSDLQPGDDGPRRVTQDEIRGVFRDGWTVKEIRAAQFETNAMGPERPVGALAWLAIIIREGARP